MLTLKVLSLLLCYPEAALIEALDVMADAVANENLLPEADKNAVLALIGSHRNKDLLELQENYVALFDRGRYLSLHIFEHVHGESRERGQAMVNLMQMYEACGFEIAARELPDYIPLFLEFLSQQSKADAGELLRDAMPVLSLLGARLAERGSPYQAIFAGLAGFAGEPDAITASRQQAASEEPDPTLAQMDAIWEEEAVSFLGAGDVCAAKTPVVSPVTVTPRAEYLKSRHRSL